MNTMKIFFRWLGWMAGAIICASAFSSSAAVVTVFVGNTNLSGIAC